MIVVEKVHLCHVEANETRVTITAETRDGKSRQMTIELRYLRFVAPSESEYAALDAVYLIDGTDNVRHDDLVRLAALRDRINNYRTTYPN